MKEKWRVGNYESVVVSNVSQRKNSSPESESEDVRYYGGHLVAESLPGGVAGRIALMQNLHAEDDERTLKALIAIKQLQDQLEFDSAIHEKHYREIRDLVDYLLQCEKRSDYKHFTGELNVLLTSWGFPTRRSIQEIHPVTEDLEGFRHAFQSAYTGSRVAILPAEPPTTSAERAAAATKAFVASCTDYAASLWRCLTATE